MKQTIQLTSNEIEFICEVTEKAVQLVYPDPFEIGEDGCSYLTEEAQNLFNDLFDQIEELYLNTLRNETE